jgi:hypothetical protein
VNLETDAAFQRFMVPVLNRIIEIVNKVKGESMNTIEKEVLAAATTVAPDAPAIQVANAAIATAANPSAANILADLELVIALVKKFKADLAGVHPTVAAIVKELF